MCHLNKKIKVFDGTLILEKEIFNNTICRPGGETYIGTSEDDAMLFKTFQNYFNCDSDASILITLIHLDKLKYQRVTG